MLRGVRAHPGQWLRAACDLRARMVVAVTVAAAAGLTTAVAFGAASKIVEIPDAKGDVTGVLDLQRASLNLASDGRLRAVVTVARKIDPREMLAGTGPPGSVCMKIWTDEDADPAAVRADRLVCVTARSSEELRASVLTQTAPGLPVRVASAPVSLTKSGRSIVLRISQSSLGRPELIRFAVESTRPGCERVSCVDEAPDQGAVRRFRVR
jgi:hypothetical protein